MFIRFICKSSISPSKSIIVINLLLFDNFLLHHQFYWFFTHLLCQTLSFCGSSDFSR